jgi:diguanylate cyclase (GGDEF)-like protein/PAS domain S-box-containing protein
VAGCFLFAGCATVFAGFVAEGYILWLANGVVLAYLLLAPRHRWTAYLLAGSAAHLIGSALLRTAWPLNLIVTPLDALEVFATAALLRPCNRKLPDFTSREYLLRFIAIAVIGVPLAAGCVFAVLSASFFHMPIALALLRWSTADGLGAGVTIPACVAIFRTRFRRSHLHRIDLFYLPLVLAASIAVFALSDQPLYFVIYPILIVVLLRMGMGWAAMATLSVSAIACWCTGRGMGPFNAGGRFTQLEASLFLHVFIASALFMLYSVSVVLESLLSTEHRLGKIAALHNLVTENSRDLIVIADFNGNRSYVSGAVSGFAGWNRQELLEIPSLELVHPNDRESVVAKLTPLKEGADGTDFECRMKRKDGRYGWVEATARTIRDPHTQVPVGILNTARDITERKLAEKRLEDAYHAVEALAITDGLTGLANRRRFDQSLIAEWRRSMRTHLPLSLLLIDADHFKAYNDTYGHLRGDSCLKQIAEAAQDVVARPGDLVARFGGEEFAVLLPSTAIDGAAHIAEEICTLLRTKKLPHKGNATGLVTISIGCASLVPRLGQTSTNLIELADEALYQAKRNGRNSVCCSRSEDVIQAPQAVSGKSA